MLFAVRFSHLRFWLLLAKVSPPPFRDWLEARGRDLCEPQRVLHPPFILTTPPPASRKTPRSGPPWSGAEARWQRLGRRRREAKPQCFFTFSIGRDPPGPLSLLCPEPPQAEESGRRGAALCGAALCGPCRSL